MSNFKLLPVMGCLAALFISGCATGSGTTAADVVSDAVQDVSQGIVLAQDVYTVGSAIYQTQNGHSLASLSTVESAATAGSTSANSTGLLAAAKTLYTDVSGQVATLEKSGVPAATALTAANTSLATAEVTVAATPATAPATE